MIKPSNLWCDNWLIFVASRRSFKVAVYSQSLCCNLFPVTSKRFSLLDINVHFFFISFTMLTTFVQWCNFAELTSTGNYVKVPHSSECVPRPFVLDTQPKCIVMNSFVNKCHTGTRQGRIYEKALHWRAKRRKCRWTRLEWKVSVHLLRRAWMACRIPLPAVPSCVSGGYQLSAGNWDTIM